MDRGKDSGGRGGGKERKGRRLAKKVAVLSPAACVLSGAGQGEEVGENER